MFITTEAKRGVPWNPWNPPWIRHCIVQGSYDFLLNYMQLIKLCTCMSKAQNGQNSSLSLTSIMTSVIHPSCSHLLQPHRTQSSSSEYIERHTQHSLSSTFGKVVTEYELKGMSASVTNLGCLACVV